VTLTQSATDAPSTPVVAAICAAEILGLAGFSIVPALLPQVIEAWSLTNTQAGWLAGIDRHTEISVGEPVAFHERSPVLTGTPRAYQSCTLTKGGSGVTRTCYGRSFTGVIRQVGDCRCWQCAGGAVLLRLDPERPVTESELSADSRSRPFTGFHASENICSAPVIASRPTLSRAADGFRP
jgi:hypothetical protein